MRCASTAALALVACLVARPAGARPTPVGRGEPDGPIVGLDRTPHAVVDEASRRLLAAAAAAKSAGDAAELERWLRGWATLGAREGTLPDALSAEAATAIAWAKDAGVFGLFASRLPDRVSVGVHDPAHLLVRVDVWVADEGRPRRVVRAEGERLDRREYPLSEENLRGAEVVIDAVARVRGEDVVVARARLAPPAFEPPAPPSTLWGGRLRDRSDRTDRTDRTDATEREGPLVPWWWVALGAVAVGLAGAAVWQESRF